MNYIFPIPSLLTIALPSSPLNKHHMRQVGLREEYSERADWPKVT